MKPANTVGELIALLQELDPSLPLILDGPDSGGYDVTFLVGGVVARGAVHSMSSRRCNSVEGLTQESDREAFKRHFPRGAVRLVVDGRELYDLLRSDSHWYDKEGKLARTGKRWTPKERAERLKKYQEQRRTTKFF